MAAWGGRSERYPRSEDSEESDAGRHASQVSTPLFDDRQVSRTPISARLVDLGSPGASSAAKHLPSVPNCRSGHWISALTLDEMRAKAVIAGARGSASRRVAPAC